MPNTNCKSEKSNKYRLSQTIGAKGDESNVPEACLLEVSLRGIPPRRSQCNVTFSAHHIESDRFGLDIPT
jgi:hypothetical protein